MKTNVTMCMALLLSTAALAAPGGGNTVCEDIRYTFVGIQDDPAGIFRGELTVEILEPDVNGVLQPTGEAIDFDFTSTLLGQVDEVSGRTSNALRSKDGKITLTSFDEYSVVPLANGELGLVDVGDVLLGEGRWNCGRTVGGINPITGEPLSRIRFYDPVTGTPGRAEGVIQGRWCDCSGENQ